MNSKLYRLCFIVSLLLLPFLSFGQQAKQERCIVTGKVVDDKTGEPQFGVVASIFEYNIWYLSLDDGSFELKNVPAGKVTITFQRIGLKETKVV